MTVMSCIPGCLYMAAYCSIFYYSKYTVFSVLIYLAQSESFFKNRILSIMYIIYLNWLLTAMLLIGLRLSSATGLAMLLDSMHHRGCPLRKSLSGGSSSLKQLCFQGLILEEMEEDLRICQPHPIWWSFQWEWVSLSFVTHKLMSQPRSDPNRKN